MVSTLLTPYQYSLLNSSVDNKRIIFNMDKETKRRGKKFVKMALSDVYRVSN